MTGTADDSPVSRARYDRERRARIAAESLLEAKSREVFEANQRLIHETESVRTALSETEALRQREAAALRDRTILNKALTALSGRAGAADAMQALLDVLRREFGIFDALFVQARDGQVQIAAAAAPGHAGLILPLPVAFLARPRRLARLVPTGDGPPLPEPLATIDSVMCAPLALPDDPPGALLLCCESRGRFSAGDLKTLEQVARVAAQSLLALREARRNALLVSLVEGKPLTDPGGVLDAPLEAIHRAFTRLTDMQGQVVGILDALLGAPLQMADAAIDAALARMGDLTGTDRVYVFMLRSGPDGSFIDNTHEWCATDIAPMRDMLQGIPADMIDHWRVAFDVGDDVMIPDVAAMPDTAPEKEILLEQNIQSLLAVPMMSDGRFQGFVGYDAVRTRRSFMPGEVYLVRSVAKVIASILARRDADVQLVAAHAEATSQRTRLEAVLSAMPDLIVELDREGRFVTWHSGAIVVPDALAAAFAGHRIDDTLPPDLASDARGVLDELDISADSVVTREFRYALGDDTDRCWQLSASPIADTGYLFVLRDVTAARAQTAEIERLSEIARRTTNLVIVTDVARRIEWVNAAFERTTGWRLDEVRGWNAGHFLQSDDADPAAVAQLRHALDAGTPTQVEVLNEARDGRAYRVAIDIQPLRDGAGVLQGFMAVETDVTERHLQAEAQRRAADEAARARATLEAAVDALQDGFVLFDADDRLVLCNEKYRELYARSAPAVVPGATFEQILRYGLAHGEYTIAADAQEAWLAERVSRHGAAISELEQQLSDGRWLRIFERQTPDGGRVGLRVDITALKLAEQRALADRSAAMEASQDGIAITDAAGRFQYMNRAHLDLFGYGKEAEVIGQPWAALYGSAEAAWMEANAMPALRDRGRWSGEVPGRARDGSVVDQDVALTLKDDGGVLWIARDMRDRRAEAAERDRIREELHLAQRREIVGQMAAGLAHDFNNLLAAISGSAALITTAATPGSAIAIGAGRIDAASSQAAGLVKRLLELGARQPERRLLDLRGPLREAALLVRGTLKAPTQLTLHLPDAPIEVMADPSDILQVVLNLGINARDALDGAPGEITVSLAEADANDLVGPFASGKPDPTQRHVVLSVADTGPGIPADLVARIFNPYVSTKGDKGTGLGLSIVASIVVSNGGAIRLTSDKGRGACFSILWPVAAAAAAPAAQVVEGLTGRLDGRKILLVDDQQDILDILTAFLQAAGAEVAPSTEPEDIAAAVDADPDAWDLVVTDYDMPGMTGEALADAVHRAAPGLPLILVTALAGIAGRTSQCFAAVLPKPVDREALVRAAESAILAQESKES